MAFYPDVQPGDKFQPDALLANDVRHLLNRLDGFTGSVAKETPFNNTVVQVYCQKELKPGTAVNFKDGGEMIRDVIPCEVFNNPFKPWGVVPNGLQPNKIGECVVSGAVKVNISGDIKSHALPSTKNSQIFETADTGAFILYRSQTSSDAIILLNSKPKETGYNGFFKVEVEKKGEADFRARVVTGGTINRDYCGIIIYRGKIYKIPTAEFSITDKISSIVFLTEYTDSLDLTFKMFTSKPDDYWEHKCLQIYNWQTRYLCYFDWKEEKYENKTTKLVDVIQVYELYKPLYIFSNYPTERLDT